MAVSSNKTSRFLITDRKNSCKGKSMVCSSHLTLWVDIKRLRLFCWTTKEFSLLIFKAKLRMKNVVSWKNSTLPMLIFLCFMLDLIITEVLVQQHMAFKATRWNTRNIPHCRACWSDEVEKYNYRAWQSQPFQNVCCISSLRWILITEISQLWPICVLLLEAASLCSEPH